MNKCNKSLRNVLAAALTVCAAGMARADYFVSWRVDADAATPFEFCYATMTATGGGETITLTETASVFGYDFFIADEGAYSISSLSDVERGTGTQARFAKTGAPSEYSDYVFQVQLWGEDEDSPLAVSETKTFAQLQDDINCVNLSVDGKAGEGVWAVQGFNAVPEPTSGMLFLLGLASLALRRKRV